MAYGCIGRTLEYAHEAADRFALALCPGILRSLNPVVLAAAVGNDPTTFPVTGRCSATELSDLYNLRLLTAPIWKQGSESNRRRHIAAGYEPAEVPLLATLLWNLARFG